MLPMIAHFKMSKGDGKKCHLWIPLVPLWILLIPLFILGAFVLLFRRLYRKSSTKLSWIQIVCFFSSFRGFEIDINDKNQKLMIKIQ